MLSSLQTVIADTLDISAGCSSKSILILLLGVLYLMLQSQDRWHRA